MSVLCDQEVSYVGRTGTGHAFTVTATPATGQVWVPAYLPATEPRLGVDHPRLGTQNLGTRRYDWTCDLPRAAVDGQANGAQDDRWL